VGDAAVAGQSGEFDEQAPAEPVLLMEVGDLDGDLGPRGLLARPEVVGGTDQFSGLECPDRLVHLVVNCGEVTQVAGRSVLIGVR